MAVELGAWAVGMVFHRESPRSCPVDDAFEIASAVKRNAESVGVFVNSSLDSVARIADLVGLTMVQLHGDEGPDYCAEIARRTGCQIIKAARVKSPADITDLRRYRTGFHLLDAHVTGVPGGTGETFPWEFAKTDNGGAPVILAGGLTATNVVEAINQASPFAVDTSSGVESSPGVKDHVAMREFHDAVRSLDPLVVEEPSELEEEPSEVEA